jgi:FkbM family methyltransferase
MKKIIKYIFRLFGLEISRVSTKKNIEYTLPSNFTMKESLRNMREYTNFSTIIDVGASNGIWSELCMQYYPESFYLLIEAQKEHQLGLEHFVKKYPKSSYVLKAAGNKKGEIYFDNTSLFGGVASEIPFEKNNIVVPVTTIDIEVSKKQLPPPYCIKLDTHGYEIPILEGAAETLKNTNLLVIEAYNFQIAHKSLRFWELCSYLEKLGFLPVDMVDFMRRIKDNAFWQFDIFFLRAEHPIFNYNSYE